MPSSFDIQAPVAELSSEAKKGAIQRQAQLTKPPGSLGVLEDIALMFAAWQNKDKPMLSRIALRIYAADHGVADPRREGASVSAFPQEVTGQMIRNFSTGGAAISVLAGLQDFDFEVLNLGTAQPLPDMPKVKQIQIVNGSADFTRTPAMKESELQRALLAGANSVPVSAQLFIGGEMGIGNTTSASALLAGLFDMNGAIAAGRGTGVNDEGLASKVMAIDQALELHRPNASSSLDWLRCLGGLEIAALVGAYVRSAQLGIPVLVDGFITSVAAACAVQINPKVRDWMLFSHCSAGRAHRKVLELLDAEPLLNLGMRLGEATGAAVAVPIIQSALSMHSYMDTFDQAGVATEVAAVSVSNG